MLSKSTRMSTWLIFLAFIPAVTCFVNVSPAEAQATTSTGSIQGTIVDAKGGVVSSAKVTLINNATGQNVTEAVNDAGVYVSGALKPGEYVVRVEAGGFKTAELTVVVEVGVVSSGNVSLDVGSEKTVVTVEASAIAVNEEQPTVQGVLTSQQIEALPINGRNFLDLAQLEPGVQIQDGANFDPTKNGFSSISFAGHFGRTTRIEVDGVDISDETVGTTTQNIPQLSIREFQIGQSSLDLSTELTSTGTVNVVTRSGANDYHGEGFFNWRGDSVSAKLGPAPVPFDRKQYGARLAGRILKDKLFFFGAGERAQQSLQALQVIPPPFSISESFDSPFHDTQYIGKLDWQALPNLQLFYRFSYEQNRTVKGVIPNNFQPFANADNTPVHAMGVDYSHGTWTHSLRVGYTKFRNGINDAVLGTNIFDPSPGIAIEIGGDPFCLTTGLDPFCSGPNFLAPQKTFQSNKQTKYDATKTWGRHTIRFGGGVNRIQGGVFAAFIGSAPLVGSNFSLGAGGVASNPLNYTVDSLFVGNGQGFFTERPGFGFPGGESADTRLQVYVGDVWKVRPNISLTAGLRYVRDSGRTDSDLPAIPCSALNAQIQAAGFTCTGNLLDQFGPGLGGQVRQPNKNFSPQIGVAWDPMKNHKTVIRAGFSLNYENALFNNVLFDRSGRLAQGLFLVTQNLCPGGQLLLPGGGTLDHVPSNGHVIKTAICGQPIANVAADAMELEAVYKQATLSAGAQSNGGFIGNLLADTFNLTLTDLLAPNYRSPYSMEFNVGVSRELRPGTVLTVDYLRNVALHGLIGVDSNHVGDSRYLNTAAAVHAMTLTAQQFCNNGIANLNPTTGAFISCTGVGGTECSTFAGTAMQIDCTIAGGATIDSYARNGLDSGNAFNSGGLSAWALGRNPDQAAAFPGVNKNVGTNQMLFPIGRSVYNGLQVKLTSQWSTPLPGLRSVNSVVSYALSRATASVRDVDFINNGYDFRNPSISGPNGLDRTHQFSAGATLGFKYGAELSFITHWNSALPADVRLPSGSIFTADLNGDGSFSGFTLGQAGELLPGTNPGSFGRDFGVAGLRKLIDAYNNNIAGKVLTPAGQALVDAQLFTSAQLFSLGATPQAIADPPPGQVGLDSFFTFDLRLGWNVHPVKQWERLVFAPQVNIYNLFNRQNYDSPSLPMSGILNGSVGTLNGTTAQTRPNLIGLGSGVFALGAPRSLEFGFKVVF